MELREIKCQIVDRTSGGLLWRRRWTVCGEFLDLLSGYLLFKIVFHRVNWV